MSRIGGRIVRPGAVVPGYVDVDGTTIRSIEADDRAGDDVIVPGFVDLHCHGGGGYRTRHTCGIRRSTRWPR